MTIEKVNKIVKCICEQYLKEEGKRLKTISIGFKKEEHLKEKYQITYKLNESGDISIKYFNDVPFENIDEKYINDKIKSYELSDIQIDVMKTGI